MKIFKRAILRLLAVLLPPFLVMGGSFTLMKLFRDTYTAESSILYSPGVSVSKVRMGPAKETVSREHAYLSHLSDQIKGESILTLTCMAFVVSDLNDRPWRPERSATLSDSLQQLALQRLPAITERLRTLTPPNPATEDSLLAVLRWLNYTPEGLRRLFVVHPIPRTSRIRVQASALNPEFSIYLANSLSRIASKYLTSQADTDLGDQLAQLAHADSLCHSRIACIQDELDTLRQRLYAAPAGEQLRSLQTRMDQLAYRQAQLKHRLTTEYGHSTPAKTPPKSVGVRVSDPPSLSQSQVYAVVAELAQVDAEMLRLQRAVAQQDSLLLADSYAQLNRQHRRCLQLQQEQQQLRKERTFLPQRFSPYPHHPFPPS